MKVFIAALDHETNSFSPIPTNRESFEATLLFDPLAEPDRDPETVFVGYGDFYRLARARGYEVALSIAAWAQPSAPTVQADYEALRDRIIDDLKAALPVQMVLLMLHGAQMATACDDCEGDLLSRVRDVAGPDVPVGVELDLHCNITDRMVAASTAIIACKEYPHTDFPDRAAELFGIIEKTATGELRPTMVFRRLPMLAKFHTTREPMRGFVDRLMALEGRDGILSISLAHGFPWSDMADTGSGVLVVTDNDPAKAKGLADCIGREFFSYRDEVHDKFLTIDAALDAALAADDSGKPVVIADVSDNAGGGAPGDSTFLLGAMLDRGVTNAALGMIWDPIAVEMAAKAGTGAEIPMRIGGKMGPVSGPPLDVSATVTALADSPAQRGLDPNIREALGASAAIRVGGVDIVLNSIRQQVFSPDCFTELGIDLAGKRLLVVKSSQHFHQFFAPLAAQVLYCDAPGALNSDLAALPYRKLRRPIWPLDDLHYPEQAEPSARSA